MSLPVDDRRKAVRVEQVWPVGDATAGGTLILVLAPVGLGLVGLTVPVSAASACEAAVGAAPGVPCAEAGRMCVELSGARTRLLEAQGGVPRDPMPIT